MGFRVQHISTRIVTHPLRADRIVVSHVGRHDESRFLTVTVQAADGQLGYGEAAVTALWNGESAESARWAVEELFAPRISGATLDHPREALAVMDRAAFGLPFAKAALDTALWDLFAKTQGASVSKLVRDREPLPSLPTRASVGCYPPDETVRIARDFWQAGIRTLKFKIGMAGIDDTARLSAVREALGAAPVFTVDANGAYQSMEDAVRAIEALLPFNLALVEQPVPRERRKLMAEVRRRIPVPVLMDEGVFSPLELADALDLDCFDFLSIYPGKNGGFTHALDMAQTAQAAGKACVIGCNLETDLGQAAMACLAASLTAFPAERLVGDFPAAIFYERSSVKQPLEFREGRVKVPDGLGFGVEPC